MTKPTVATFPMKRRDFARSHRAHIIKRNFASIKCMKAPALLTVL
jgi:hypothetical protein